MVATLKRHIVAAAHDAHGTIYVAEDPHGTTRTLNFDTTIEQSRYYLHAPFTLGFEYLQTAFNLLIASHPDTLLTLGLGGGRLNTHLYYALPQCRQHIIELRPQVIQLAHQWFDLPQTEEIAIESGDAFHYACTSKRKYDAVFIDLFDGEGMPTQFTSDTFLQHVLQCCHPGGTILMNLWRNDTSVNKSLLPWLQATQLDFTLHTIKSSPNWILEIKR